MNLNNRHSYLDWLRMLAILGVLLFHSAMPFASEEFWHIKNQETSNLMLEFNFFLSRFRMPLLFFISGAICFFMLQRRTAGSFVGLRFKRLFIPLLFGMLVVVPPQIFIERVNQGYTGNFFEFYPSIFEGRPYPDGNTSWHHLWFILYLFIYDIIALPFFIWVIRGKSTRLKTFMNWLSMNGRVYLLLIPGVIGYVSLIGIFPQTNDLIHDWAMFVYWFGFFLAGFIIVSQPSMLESIVKTRRISLLIAFLVIIMINYFRWNSLEPWDRIANWKGHWMTHLFRSLYVVLAYAAVFALIGYGKKYFNRPHRILEYANPAVYPFYILHQTVIVILAFYVVKVQESILSKYAFIVAASFLITIGLYHLIIRRTALTRFFFGMKAANETKQVVKAESKKEQLLMSPGLNA